VGKLPYDQDTRNEKNYHKKMATFNGLEGALHLEQVIAIEKILPEK
jgi:hypothetical protein